MDPVLQKALERKKQLQEELRRIEEFLRLYEEFSDTPSEHTRTRVEKRSPAIPLAPLAPESNHDDTSETENYAGSAETVVTPRRFTKIAKDVLLAVGHPLSRGSIVKALEDRGCRIPSRDKPGYIGTLMHRRSEHFENIKGWGYWPKDTPFPPAEYHPEQSVSDLYFPSDD